MVQPWMSLGTSSPASPESAWLLTTDKSVKLVGPGPLSVTDTVTVTSNSVCRFDLAVDGFALQATVGATVSTVHVRVAGVASALPAVAVARTEEGWGPSLRPG